MMDLDPADVGDPGGTTVRNRACSVRSGAGLILDALDRDSQFRVLQAAVTATRMPMVVTDPRQPDNPVVLANRAFLEVTGYSAEEVLGRNPRFMQGADSDPAALARIRNALDEVSDLEIELVNQTKDGTPVITRLLISPIFDEDGTLAFFFGSQVDLRAERAAEAAAAQKEERLRLVAAEMNHRINNTLATVQAIVRQTLRNAGVPTAVGDAIGGRLVALRDAHALLTQRDWQSSGLHELIESAIQPHRDDAERFTVRGPKIDLEPAPGVAVSMAMHELCTNAVKYGALSVPSGHVDIGWNVESTDGARHLLLHWQEQNGPPVHAPKHKGFGSILIKDALAAELNGAVELSYEATGLTCTIRAALPAI
jgi:PAS domain S-box-containing protein